jgi:hypothetical protein
MPLANLFRERHFVCLAEETGRGRTFWGLLAQGGLAEELRLYSDPVPF